MSILIAFFGGMLTLLSPCTLPVIPLLFASVRGRRGQLAIMLAGMALMFGAVSWLVTVASGEVSRCAMRCESRLSPTRAKNASAAGSVRCWPGWRWGCCGRRAPGRYWGRY